MSRPTELLFLDVETTGLNPRAHEVVEAAGIRTSLDGHTILERWDFKMRPERLEGADPEALRVNGFSWADWQEAVSQAEGARLLSERLTEARVAGQHVAFDLGFLQATLERHGLKAEWNRHAVDVASLAWPLFLANPGMEGVSLKHTAPMLGLAQEQAIHRAAMGAELARRVYVALLDFYGPGPWG